MKTKQVNPMPAFIKSGLDCRAHSFAPVTKRRCYYIDEIHSECRLPLVSRGQVIGFKIGYYFEGHKDVFFDPSPRLNNPQVLPDWGWLDNPLLDGFVWEVRWFNEIAEMLYTETVNSKKCFEIATHPLHDFLHAEIKGVQKGSQLEDWAIENDVPVIGGD